MFVRLAVYIVFTAVLKYFASKALFDAFTQMLDEPVSQKHDDDDNIETPQSEPNS